MAITEGKNKKPPTFHYLPKSRAKQLKKSWVEGRKIRSRWKAQKRREGLINQTSTSTEGASNHGCNAANAGSQADTLLHSSDESKPIPKPSQSSRDLKEIACTSKRSLTQNFNDLRSKRAPGHPQSERGKRASERYETGQPNMKLRMNVLLEKIKRDLS